MLLVGVASPMRKHRLKLESLEPRYVLTPLVFESHPVLTNIEHTGEYLIQDFDHDGDLDVVTRTETNRFQFFERTTESPAYPVFEGVNQFMGGVFADLDGNGIKDVVAITEVSVDGPGGQLPDLVWVKDFHLFDESPLVNILSENDSSLFVASRIETLDVNSDGDLDILVGPADSSWQLLENTGGGVFSAPQPTGLDSSFDRFWDMDGDGHVDAIRPDPTTDRLQVSFNVNGIFQEPADLLDANANPILISEFNSLEFADVDHDGDGDFVATKSAAIVADHEVLLFEQQLDGKFARQVIYSHPIRYSAIFDRAEAEIRLSDIDGDDDQDIFLLMHEYQDSFGGSTNAEVVWLLNDNGFTANSLFDRFHEQVTDVYFEDFDSDGDQDVLVAREQLRFPSLQVPGPLVLYTNSQSTLNSPELAILEFIRPTKTLAADIDGDGDQDVIGASSRLGYVYWAENTDGSGTFGPLQIVFQFPVSLFHQVGSGDEYVSAVHASDLNNDGSPDLVIVQRATGEILWLPNQDGQGNFGDPRIITDKPLQPTDVAIGDLDNDGDQDVVSIAVQDGKLAWYRNKDADDDFSSERIIIDNVNFTDYYTSVELADMDGDGSLDVVALGTQGLLVFRNANGRGSFDAPLSINVDFHRVGGTFDVGDIDGDGDFDLAVSAIVSDQSNVSVLWIENQGNLVFGQPQVLNSNYLNVSVALEDLDLDGDTDILFGFSTHSAPTDVGIGWFEQTSSVDAVAFRDATTITLDSLSVAPYEIETADFDGDQRPDILGTQPTRARIEWVSTERDPVLATWHNAAFPTDVDASGEQGPLDALLVINELNDRVHTLPDGSFISASRPDGVSFFDVNADGVVSPIDALAVINSLDEPAAIARGLVGWGHGGLGSGLNGTSAVHVRTYVCQLIWAGRAEPP
jgi:hypothetical protein